MPWKSVRVAPLAIAAALTVSLVAATGAPASHAGDVKHTTQGPSSSQSPYLVPVESGVKTTSILTVGDSVNLKPDGTPYRLVGLPDGLGAFDNGDNTFTVLMNHELQPFAGITRAHGSIGAFVSRWVIEKDSLKVLHGEDLVKQVATWNTSTGSYNAPAAGWTMGRLCSATLAPVSAFYNKETGKGYNGRIFTDGEELDVNGRAYGHLLNGTSYELPAIGKLRYENVVPHADLGDRTVAVATKDWMNGQVFVYAGDKQKTGNPIERAGLNNGNLFGIQVEGIAVEPPEDGIPSGTRFSVHNYGDVRGMSSAELTAESQANGVTEFNRPEDGAWDTTDPRRFYFNTTGTYAGRNSRLWRLTFDDPAHPEKGGKIEMMLDGSEGHHNLDNMAVNWRGQVIAQEGDNPGLSPIWRYTPRLDRLTEVATHDPRRFQLGGSMFLTEAQESSGIIDVSDILGQGWYVATVQAPHALPPELAPELFAGGQLLALRIPPRNS